MNLRNISANQIVVWCALLLGLLAAVVIGSAVGSSDMRLAAAVIVAVPTAVIFVKLKLNIWVLLPISWYLNGRLPWLPLPLTVRDICFLAVIFFFTLFFATRALPWKRKLNTLDYLIYINVAYLATVYARNPVGFSAMQSAMVGGRPYFEVALACGAFAVLSRVSPTQTIAKIFPLFYLIPTTVVATLDMIARLVPQFAYPIATIYSGAGSLSMTAGLEKAAEVGEDRITGLKDVGFVAVLALCAKYNPITLLSPLYPFRIILFVTAFGAIFLSGFRATLLASMVFFALATVLRGRGRDMWIAASAGIVGIVLLISMQGTLIQFPLTMQRALSWLPGDWNQEAVEDAEASSRWRFEMVEWAWNDDRILRNKVWGQGIGLSLDDMNLITASMIAGAGGANLLGGSDRENFMITGTFHNGPISAIKCVGVVGLFLYSVLIFYLAVRAWKLCVMTSGTAAFPLALFVSIPVIYFPFQFLVVTGFYELDLTNSIYAAGLLNLVSNYYQSLVPKRSRSVQPDLQPAPRETELLRPMALNLTARGRAN